jgi:serine/threonine-protein kinase
VPQLIGGLADPASADTIAALLRNLLDNSTLPLFVAGVSHADTRIAAIVKDLLCGGGSFDPNRLLDLFQETDAPKARLIEILSRHKQALNPQALFRLLDAVDKESRTLILRLIEEAATDAMIPELTRRTGSEDWLTRLYLARTLRRFNADAARDTLTALLEDTHKTVRLAALEGLAGMQIPVNIAAVCGRLRDPDLTVQAKAIETIVQIDDPTSVHHLSTSCGTIRVRHRAAVEVLNQVSAPAPSGPPGALRARLVIRVGRRRPGHRRPQGDRGGVVARQGQGRVHPPLRRRDPHHDPGEDGRRGDLHQSGGRPG